ncbi:MAG: hypothetical protein IPL99_24745 [Candidatus Competibacteraceae bacterium]|nr:hypothetical protein [Candidatus Competibacteraceae bacterium]
MLAIPEFPPSSYAAKPTDFNDRGQIISLNAVREKIHGRLLQPYQKATPWLFSDFGNALILLEHLENELVPPQNWVGSTIVLIKAFGIWSRVPNWRGAKH